MAENTRGELLYVRFVCVLGGAVFSQEKQQSKQVNLFS